jgi:hypothetical protein
MKFREPTKLHRKSGCGHPAIVAGIRAQPTGMHDGDGARELVNAEVDFDVYFYGDGLPL